MPPVIGPVEDPERKRIRLAKAACSAEGGTWDEATQKCIPQEEEPTPQERANRPKPSETPSLVLTDEETGQPTGVQKGDSTFFLPRKDIEAVVQKDIKQFSPIAGATTVAQAREQQRIEEAQTVLQETGAPERRELDPTRIEGEELPVFGPLGALIAKTLFDAKGASREFFRDLGLIKEDTPELTRAPDISPEQLKTVALTQIEKNEIENGLSASEKFGEIIESLGLGGLSNFAAEKPSENVKTILKSIKTLKTRATNAEIKVKDGTWRQSYGEDVIDDIENQIQRAESRIKLLLQHSPEFKFDSDGVNFIEDKILEARERLFSAKINMASGPAKDPSELDVLIALKESIQAEDFEI